MKILLLSRYFYPSLGGSETNAEVLAREFTQLGHEVKVITQTIGNNLDQNELMYPFEVLRKPNFLQVINLVTWCDVYFHNGLSLRGAWPLIFLKKPWIVRHQVWLRSINANIKGIGGNSDSIIVKFKHWVCQYAISISISDQIADHLQCPSIIIQNPYRDYLFRILPDVQKSKEMVFLGRLVSEKGVDILLESFSKLYKSKLKPRLTIIGDGPEKAKLELRAKELDINQRVVFVGSKVGEELVQILNEHQIMIIPSLYDEPFGVVALEGIACGCAVVGSEGGGLKEAIGPCGVTFPNGNVQALTNVLADLLSNPSKLQIYRNQAKAHLSKHSPREVAKAYLSVLESAIS